MVFDPSEPDIDEGSFEKQDWNDTVYGEFCEEITYNYPEFRVFGFKMRDFFKPDHSGDSTNRHSSIRFIVYLNNAPIYWESNK